MVFLDLDFRISVNHVGIKVLWEVHRQLETPTSLASQTIGQSPEVTLYLYQLWRHIYTSNDVTAIAQSIGTQVCLEQMNGFYPYLVPFGLIKKNAHNQVAVFVVGCLLSFIGSVCVNHVHFQVMLLAFNCVLRSLTFGRAPVKMNLRGFLGKLWSLNFQSIQLIIILYLYLEKLVCWVSKTWPTDHSSWSIIKGELKGMAIIFPIPAERKIIVHKT